MQHITVPRKKVPIAVIIVVLILIIGCAAAWIGHASLARFVQQATLPTAVPYKEKAPATPTPQPVKPTRSPAASPSPRALPNEANLAVPFTVQAPQANWDDPYGEFCEEASVLMAASYLQNKTIPSPSVANTALLAIQAFEEKRFGLYKDTNAEQTAIILREYFSYKNVEVKQNPSIDDIKHAIAAGRVVLVPVAGREIHNPYFQQPGPLYHMLVIKGYTAQGKFITNDPGTKRGADFLYDEDIIMNAIHDWRTDGNMDLGKKVVIIAG